MGATVTITTPPAGVQFEIKRRALKSVTPQAVLAAAHEALGEIKGAVFELHGGGKGGLSRSFSAAFVDAPGTVAAGAFSDLSYARIQDEGGEILPKTARALAIPINAKGSRWPRDYPKAGPDRLFMVRPERSGKLLLCQSVGKRKRLKVMFVLVPSVEITGSGYIGIAADRAQPKIESIIGDAVDRAMIT